jgi:putative acyl-CoA dehydrogenase
LQAKLLLEAGNAAVSDAFIASRLGSAGCIWRVAAGLDVEAIVARSTPQG